MINIFSSEDLMKVRVQCATVRVRVRVPVIFALSFSSSFSSAAVLSARKKILALLRE